MLTLTTINVIAQDHIYSQFFNAPVYLNPALTGQFQGDLRMNLIYRNQFTSVPGSLNYISASIDYNIPKFGGGLGLIFTRSSEGTVAARKLSPVATPQSWVSLQTFGVIHAYVGS